MRLDGKVAIITGASGMGRAMAELFCAEGAKVGGADWKQVAIIPADAGWSAA